MPSAGFIKKIITPHFRKMKKKTGAVSNFLKVHTLHFKTAHLRISSPLGERIKVRGIYLETTLTPTLSRQRERENHGFS
jgi:hypothetical protein